MHHAVGAQSRVRGLVLISTSHYREVGGQSPVPIGLPLHERDAVCMVQEAW